MTVMRLGKDGKLAIPPEILDHYGWDEGTEIELIEADGQLLLRRRSDGFYRSPFADDGRLSTREWLEKHAGTTDSGLTTDEIMHMTRGDD